MILTTDKVMKLIICFKKSAWSVYYMGNYRYFQDTFLLCVIFTLWAYFRADLCYLLAESHYCLLCVCRYSILFIVNLNTIYYGFDFFEFELIWNVTSLDTLLSGKLHILGSVKHSCGFERYIIDYTHTRVYNGHTYSLLVCSRCARIRVTHLRIFTYSH